METPINFVEIVSPSFSGSTLIAMVLCGHPEITSVSEMTGLVRASRLDSYQCSCGELLAKCPFWNEMQVQMKKREFKLELGDFETRISLGGNLPSKILLSRSLKNTALNRMRDMAATVLPGYNAQIDRLVARNVAFVQSALEISGKRVFVDGSKDPMRLQFLSRDQRLKVKAIHLVRDPRGTITSDIRHAREQNREISAGVQARKWCREHRDIERLIRMTKVPALRVNYESFCSSPDLELKRMYDFMQVDASARFELSSIKHHVIGNRMRLNPLTEIRLDERWRSLLNTEDVKIVERITATLMKRYGYSPEQPT